MPMPWHCFSSAARVPRNMTTPPSLLAKSTEVQSPRATACCFSRAGRKTQTPPALHLLFQGWGQQWHFFGRCRQHKEINASPQHYVLAFVHRSPATDPDMHRTKLRKAAEVIADGDQLSVALGANLAARATNGLTVAPPHNTAFLDCVAFVLFYFNFFLAGCSITWASTVSDIH